MKEFLYGDITYVLNGIFFKVQGELGRFAREKQYCDKIEERLKLKLIQYKRELTIGDGGNVCDFIVKDLVVVEIKVKPFLQTDDYAQVQRYLQATGLKLGLLINFRPKYVKPQRILNIHNL